MTSISTSRNDAGAHIDLPPQAIATISLEEPINNGPSVLLVPPVHDPPKPKDPQPIRWLECISAIVMGLTFGFGLVVSGMTSPQRVLGFLNIFLKWDPTLMFVMGAAVALNIVFFRFLLKMKFSLAQCPLGLPKKKTLDWQVIIGPIIFGIGWGLAGICPAPGLVNMVVGTWDMYVWVGAFVAGVYGYKIFEMCQTRVSKYLGDKKKRKLALTAAPTSAPGVSASTV